MDNPDLCEQINRLLQTYADALDRADCEGVAAVFAEHGRWEHLPDQPVEGRAAILRHLQEGIGRFAQTHHHVGPALLLRRDDGSLQSTAYFIATHVLQDGHTYTVWGRYVDQIDAGPPCRIASRQTVVHLTEGTDQPYRMLRRQPLPE
jgi:ketosteroid isomerase-like protein